MDGSLIHELDIVGVSGEKLEHGIFTAVLFLLEFSFLLPPMFVKFLGKVEDSDTI